MKEAAMVTITEFWPLIRQVAEAYDQSGLTADERTQAHLATFRELPATVRRQLLTDVFRLSLDLPELYAGHGFGCQPA
jgi:hypothetical protein